MEPDADVSSGLDLRRFRVVSALRLASQVIISGQFECYRLIASLEDFGYFSGSRLRTHRSMHSSTKILDHDDVAAFTSSCQRQLPAITRPVKVENLSRLKVRNLLRRTANQVLSPDVGDAVMS